MAFKSIIVVVLSFFLFFAAQSRAADKYTENIPFDVDIDAGGGEYERKRITCNISSKSWDNENFDLKLTTGATEKSCNCTEQKPSFLNPNKFFHTPYKCSCEPETPWGVKNFKWSKFNSRKQTCYYFIKHLFELRPDFDIP